MNKVRKRWGGRLRDEVARRPRAYAGRGLSLTLWLLLLSPPQSALAALQPGVHGSPGSPAGKEYAFPLGQARGIGGNSGGFGRGITPPGAAQVSAANAGGSGLGINKGSARSGESSPNKINGKGSSIAGIRHRSTGSGTRSGTTFSASPSISSGGAATGALWMLGSSLCVIALGILVSRVLLRLTRQENDRPE